MTFFGVNITRGDELGVVVVVGREFFDLLVDGQV